MKRTTWFERALGTMARFHAGRILRRVLADVDDATRVQDRLLQSMVRANATSEFGRLHGFNSIRRYRDFAQRMPVTRYADLAPWVDRVKAGDIGAMFGEGQRVHMLAMTSGTVDKPKYVPVTDRFLKDIRGGWSAFGIKALMDHPSAFMRSIVQVTSSMDEERTSAGLPCGAITGLMAATQNRVVRRYYVAPLCVADILDPQARRYTIMRLSIPEDVGWAVTASPATMLQLARAGDENSESIIGDVRDGTLSKDVDVPDAVRVSLRPRLVPEREAARRLEEIRRRTGSLRPKDYWRLGFVANWMGGTMGLYVNRFPSYFGDVPVRDIGLLATEGRMSIPMEDGTAAGVAAVSSTFLEFIPAADYETARPTILRSHELEVGGEYFVLLTTSAGFYRYDICDCVRVVGFLGQAPLIEFLHKGDHVSSVTGEKVTERQVVVAFERSCVELGLAIDTFVMAPRWDDPPHYGLYVEWPADRPVAEMNGLVRCVDQHLQGLNIEYASKRSTGRLGAIRLRAVRKGFLAVLDQQKAGRFRRNNEQFKHQYLFTQPGQEDNLLSGVVGSTQSHENESAEAMSRTS